MRTKASVRAALLTARERRTDAERATAGLAIADALHAVLRDADRVAAYVGIGTEPPTTATLARCDDLGRAVLLPLLRPDGDLDWAPSGDLRPAARGLLEPTTAPLGPAAIATCDVVLVPAVAVDGVGRRLGRGGGSYDRALARATGLTIAVLYDDELLDSIPTEPHDVPVGAVVTPSGGLIRLR
jgi:5-formyltetrahydrofolate cyclo-ligase